MESISFPYWSYDLRMVLLLFSVGKRRGKNRKERRRKKTGGEQSPLCERISHGQEIAYVCIVVM